MAASPPATPSRHSRWLLSSRAVTEIIAGFRTPPTAWRRWWGSPGFLYPRTLCPTSSWVAPLGTPSAVSPSCVSSRLFRALGLGLLPAAAALAQLSTGTIEGRVPNAGAPVFITGPAGFHAVVQANASGRFSITLPYGRY